MLIGPTTSYTDFLMVRHHVNALIENGTIPDTFMGTFVRNLLQEEALLPIRDMIAIDEFEQGGIRTVLTNTVTAFTSMDQIAIYMTHVGVRFAEFGVTEDMVDPIHRALADVLAEEAPYLWTPETMEAWHQFLTFTGHHLRKAIACYHAQNPVGPRRYSPVIYV